MQISWSRTATPTSIALPAPTYSVWDFEETSVSSWDSDVTAGTEVALESAIATAMADVGSVSVPKHHRIEWTGGDIASMNLSTGASTPSKGTVYVLVEPTTSYTEITNGLTISSGVSDVKFKGFRMEPSSTDFSGGLARCVSVSAVGSGKRLAFGDCQFGAHWRAGAVSTYPEVIGGSSLSGWEVSIKDSDARGIFQFADMRAGYYHFENNLVTDTVDDFAACTVRNVSPNTCYLYAARNIWVDSVDSATYSAFHPDFVQTGVPADSSSDTYTLEVFGNIIVGDTYQQYPTHFGIIQNEGSATGFTQNIQDNVALCTGLRGWWTVDRSLTFKRNFMGWPPLGGAVPTTGTGWSGGPYRQYLNAQADVTPGGTTDIGTYVAGQNAQTSTAWTPANPTFIASHTATLGTATAYDTRFASMTGLSFNGSTLIINNGWSAVSRTRSAIRSWVSTTYAPTNGANVGWVANGFNDPSEY